MDSVLKLDLVNTTNRTVNLNQILMKCYSTCFSVIVFLIGHQRVIRDQYKQHIPSQKTVNSLPGNKQQGCTEARLELIEFG